MKIFDKESQKIELVDFGSMQNDFTLKSTYLGWLNDMEVMSPIASQELMQPKGPEFVEQSFLRFTSSNCKGFFVRFVPDDILIGTAKLDYICPYTNSAQDGIMIGNRNYQGLGLAKCVYRVLLAYGFQELKLNRISGGCNEGNIPMIRTFERLGYIAEGCFRMADSIDGKLSDHLYFGILNKEFNSANQVKLEIIIEESD